MRYAPFFQLRLRAFIVPSALSVIIALGLLLHLPAVSACFIDGRLLSFVEDIQRARGVFVVEITGKTTPNGAEYKVIKVLSKSSDAASVQAGAFMEAPIAPQGLLKHAKQLVLFQHASDYWEIRPASSVEKFVESVLSLPKANADDIEAWRERLAFFLAYLDYMDPNIVRGAEQEFSRAPYQAIVALKPLIDHDKALTRVQNPRYTAQRLQINLTLLAVSGGPGDAAVVESLIRKRWQQSGTDSLGAMLATYLELKGPSGLALFEELYFLDSNRWPGEIKEALRAIRFHLNETHTRITRETALAALRTMLERPRLAHMAIPELAEAQDWQALPQITELFRNHGKELLWLRQPVLDYLQACPLPEAKVALEAFTKGSFAVTL